MTGQLHNRRETLDALPTSKVLGHRSFRADVAVDAGDGYVDELFDRYGNSDSEAVSTDERDNWCAGGEQLTEFDAFLKHHGVKRRSQGCSFEVALCAFVA